MSDHDAHPVGEAIAGVLTKGERVLSVATQNVITSPITRDSAVVTNRRFIIYRPKLLGRMTLEDFLWQDVTDITITTKVLGAEITVTAKRKDPDGTIRAKSGQIDGLDKEAALRLYAAAQEFEQEWREKNRVRQMEEERARAGGVYLHGSAMSNPASGASGSSHPASIEDRLAKLKELLEKDLITDAEYESRKAQIISEL